MASEAHIDQHELMDDVEKEADVPDGESSDASSDDDSATPAVSLKAARSLFDRYDKDQSGSIDHNELRLLLTKLFRRAHIDRKSREEMIKRLLRKYDTDNSNKIEWSEFLLLYEAENFSTIAQIDSADDHIKSISEEIDKLKIRSEKMSEVEKTRQLIARLEAKMVILQQPTGAPKPPAPLPWEIPEDVDVTRSDAPSSSTDDTAHAAPGAGIHDGSDTHDAQLPHDSAVPSTEAASATDQRNEPEPIASQPSAAAADKPPKEARPSSSSRVHPAASDSAPAAEGRSSAPAEASAKSSQGCCTIS
eukprot:TRINITY_DN9736_c0_g1_i2.p1 TRINITY_DN9736_c0_g1~~TRINITY_DN9736_c0_g1_i2.p1  ORF type:complete len:305 (+),score=86.75 TRINITY_DN9736_c0_g1_i2:160-1074(+)